jgi:hypothetical protein
VAWCLEVGLGHSRPTKFIQRFLFRLRGYGSRSQACSPGKHQGQCLNSKLTNSSLRSTGTSRINRNARISFLGSCPTTATRSARYRCLDMPRGVRHSTTFCNMIYITRYRQPTLSASKKPTRRRSNTWRGSGRNWRTRSLRSDRRLS